MQNSVTIEGVATANGEARNGDSWNLGKLRLKNEEEFEKRNGEVGKKTLYVDTFAWGETGEALANVKEGQLVRVNGNLRGEVWDDKATGQKRSKLTVEVRSLEKLEDGAKKGKSSGKTVLKRNSRSGPKSDLDLETNSNDDDSEIPF